MAHVTVDIPQLRNRMRSTLADHGHPLDQSSVIANHLIEASLTGHDSHGVEVLPLVLSHAKPVDTPLIPRHEGAVTLLDGHGASGYIVGNQAVEVLLDQDTPTHRACGITNIQPTLGCLGVYGRRVARSGQAFLGASVSPPAMAMQGSTQALLGTNPICVAVPIDRGTLVIDMACSVVSWGKASETLARTGQLPLEWGQTVDGEILLNPLGGYKGLLLAACVELLCAAMTEAEDRTEGEWSGVFASFKTGRSLRMIATQIAQDLRMQGGDIRYPGEQGIAPNDLAISAGLAKLLNLL